MYEKILVVDDEASIVDIIKYNLEKEGFRPITASDGYAAMEAFQKEEPDLVILDVMMPGMDGYEVCRKIRETSNVPIIMVTARAEEIDTVLGLEMGADEYVTKPFSMRELMARVRTGLRRYSALTQKSTAADGNYTAGDFLMSKRGQIFSRDEILQKVWGYEAIGEERTVDVTIRRLREKIERDSSQPVYILTKRGVGYYFTDKI